MKPTSIPLPLRRLRADMEIKGLCLKSVSNRSGVPYVTCSQILNHRLIHAQKLAAITKAIRSAPMPEEAGLKG